MATIPRAVLDVVSAQVNALSADAQEKLMRVLSRIEWTPGNIAECRAIVVEAMQAVMPGYTALAAQASADLYDAVREASVGEALGAVAESGYSPEATDGAVRAGVQKIVDCKAVEVFNDYILQRADYEIRRAANYCITANGARDPLKPKYARVPTGAETCDFCLMLASRGFVYHSTSSAAVDHTHASCVLPGTKLGSVDANALLRREFKGIVVDITTSSGRNLTVTPNHPILTVNGWVKAERIKNGDTLLCRCRGDGDVFGIPYVDDCPTSAQEIFETLSIASSSLNVPMEVATADFDGEMLPNSDVEVIDVNRLFESYVKSVGGEVISDKLLAMTALLDGCDPLTSPSTPYSGNGRCPLSSICFVGCPRLSGSVFRGHFGSSELSGGSVASSHDSGVVKPPINDRPGHAVPIGKFKDALSALVSLYDAGRCGDSLRMTLDAAALHGFIDLIAGNSELVTDFSGGHSGGIEFDDVAIVTTRQFSGHVYNLSTDGHWYFANDIVVHNCDCRVICGFPGDEVEDYDPDALYRDWQSSIKSLAAERAERNGTTKDAELSRIMRGYGNASKAAKKRAKRA